MGKRFTAPEKWADVWFRRLSPTHKLAWIYLTDNCDHAGVIELDSDLAEFQIGGEVDWDAMIGDSGGRIVKLPCGKLWLTKYIEFQHGALNPDNKAHRPAIHSFERHNLGAIEGPSKGHRSPLDATHRGAQVKVKVKVKDKVKVKVKGADEKNSNPTTPPILDTPEFHAVMKRWKAYKGTKYKPKGLQSLLTQAAKRAEAHGVGAVVNAFDQAMADSYEGWNFDKYFNPSGNSRGSPPKSRTQSAIERYLGNSNDQTTFDCEPDVSSVRRLGPPSG